MVMFNMWKFSCGRKETGGNQHTIEHYKKTSHPLVVKTGTITTNGRQIYIVMHLIMM
jgi:uncharacterized UBP type Zn finger protein